MDINQTENSIIIKLREADYDKTFLFLVINRDQDKDRLKVIQKALENIKTKFNINFVWIKAINGYDLENDPDSDAVEILKPREQLIGREFVDLESDDKWIYDGTINNSFPKMKRKCHWGQKGVVLSNIKAFLEIKKHYNDYKYYCILEDDAIINEEVYLGILDSIKKHSRLHIIALHIKPWEGAVGMLYRNDIIDSCIEHLHPLSEFSIKINTPNLWDLKMWVYLSSKAGGTCYPLIKHGNFKSTMPI